MASLQGQVVAITGAASGIGFSIAKILASHGALLSLSDLNANGLAKAAEELLTAYGNRSESDPSPIFVKALDVRSADDVEEWIKSTVSHFNGAPLAGAANMAGIAGPSIFQPDGEIVSLSMEEWNLVTGVHINGTMNCMRAQLPAMKKGDPSKKGRGGGSIVNASSLAGHVGVGHAAAYSTSKHAILGLSKSVAQEQGKNGIRVNCVAPGFIDTPMTRDLAGDDGGEGNVTTKSSLGRAGDPDEVAQVIVFLLSDLASYVSGASIAVDGAWSYIS